MRKFALLVGVETYLDKRITPLRYAMSDATALAQRLREGCGFDGVTVLADGADASPDWPAVNDAMAELARDVRPEDLLLFYFAGHGVEVEGRRFLLTRDCPHTHPDRGLAMTQLHEWLKRVDAGRRVLLLDACRNDPQAGWNLGGNPMSSGFARDIQATSAARPGAAGVVTATLSACKPGQRAYEWPPRVSTSRTGWRCKRSPDAVRPSRARTSDGESRYAIKTTPAAAPAAGAAAPP